MKHLLSKEQRGAGHLVLIISIVVALAVGGIGWWVYNKNQNKDNVSQALKDAVKNATCDYEDKDLCKFIASWKATDEFVMNSTSETDGKTTTMAIESEGDNKSHVILTGETSYEIITIDNAMYTKGGDTWYKQTVDPSTVEPGADVDFSDPTADGKVSYKKLGTETCGELTCFKYQVVDASNPDDTQFIWFDTKHYRLQKIEITDKDGNKFSSTISYKEVNISEPSPVKELGPNEYLIPGQSQPTTLPDTGDLPSEEELQRLMEQYQ